MSDVDKYLGLAKEMMSEASFSDDVQLLLNKFESAYDIPIHECRELVEKHGQKRRNQG